jgi:hypothetical protein
VEVGGSVLEPRQEMTTVFYSVISDTAHHAFYSMISDTANHAKGYTLTADMSAVALSGDYYDLDNLPELGTIAAQDTNQINIKGGTIDGVVIGSDSAASAKFSEVNVSGYLLIQLA